MKLKQWLTDNSVTALEMGRRIGLEEPNSIYRWLRGDMKPSDAFMLKIVEVTEGAVMPNDFFNLPAIPLPAAPVSSKKPRPTIPANLVQCKVNQR